MVADTRLTTKMALNPTRGRARAASNQCIEERSQASIARKCIRFQGMFIRGNWLGEFTAVIFFLALYFLARSFHVQRLSQAHPQLQGLRRRRRIPSRNRPPHFSAHPEQGSSKARRYPRGVQLQIAGRLQQDGKSWSRRAQARGYCCFG